MGPYAGRHRVDTGKTTRARRIGAARSFLQSWGLIRRQGLEGPFSLNGLASILRMSAISDSTSLWTTENTVASASERQKDSAPRKGQN